MAKQLWLNNSAPTYHRGTNTAKLNAAASWWSPKMLTETRGGGTASVATPSVAGPTNGVEVAISGVPVEWLSEPLSADFTIAGTITLNLWAYENNMNDNVAINAVIDVIDGATGAITQIAKSARVTELAVGTSAVNNFTVAPTSTPCKKGDRLRVRVFGDDVGTMAVNATGFTVFWNSPTASVSGDSWVQFTENLTFDTAAPGATVQQLSKTTDWQLGQSTSQEKFSQPWVAVATTIHEISVALSKQGTPTDDLIIEVQSDSAGNPSGTVIATVATVPCSTLTTDVGEWKAYSNLGITGLTIGATYHLVFRRSGTLTAFCPRVSSASSAVGGILNAKVLQTGSWIAFGIPLAFIIQGTGVSTYYLTDTAESINPGSAIEKKALTTRGSGVTTAVTNTAAGPTAGIQITASAGGTAIEWYTPPLEAFTLGGKAKVGTWAVESNAAANASLRADIAICNEDGSSPVIWGTAAIEASTASGEISSVSGFEVIAWVSGDDTAVAEGKRLRFRILVEDMPGLPLVTGHTVSVPYGSPTAGVSGDAYVILPAAVTEVVTTPKTPISIPVTPVLTPAISLQKTAKRTLAASLVLTSAQTASKVFTPPVVPALDDFDRADGLVYAGAGSTIWRTHRVDAATQTQVRVYSNQLGSSGASSCVSLLTLDSDFDLLLDCVTSPSTGNFAFHVCVTDSGLSTWSGLEILYDRSSTAWYGTEFVGGVQTALGNGTSAIFAAGETYWVSKRGTTVSLYKALTATGNFALIKSWVYSAASQSGNFALRTTDGVQRWDNLRGGPIATPKTPISLSAGLNLTPAMVNIAKASRALPVSLVSTPAITKEPSKAVSASLALAPAVTKEPSRALSTPLSFSSTVTGLRAAPRAISSSLILTPALTPRVRDFFMGISSSLVLTPAQSKITTHELTPAANLVLTPTLANIATHYRAISGSLVFTPALIRAARASRVLLSSLVLTPAVIRKDYQAIAASLTLLPALALRQLAIRALNASLLLVPDMTREEYQEISAVLATVLDLQLDHKAAGEFSPDEISGLAVWLDASQLILSDGAPVNSWPNLKGGPDAPMVGSPAPVFKTNVTPSKLPTVRFTTSEARLRMTGTGVDDDFTLVYVTRVWGATNGRIVGGIYSPNNILFGNWTAYENVAYDNGFAVPNTQTPFTNSWKMYSADGAPGIDRFFSYGAELGTISTAQGFGGTLAISGYDPSTAAETCDCEVAEVVIYDRKLSDAERQQVENYLNAKWLTLAPVETINISLSAGLMVASALSDVATRYRVISGSLALAPSLSPAARKYRALTAPLALAPIFTRELYKTLNTSLVLSPVFSDVTTHEFAISSTLTLTPSQIRAYRAFRLLASSLVFTPALNKEPSRALSAGLLLTASMLRNPERNLNATLTLSPVMTTLARHYRAMAASLLLLPDLSVKSAGKQQMSANLILSTVLAREIGRGISGSLLLTPTLTKRATHYRALTASLPLAVILAKEQAYRRALSAVLSLSSVLGVRTTHERALDALLGLTAASSDMVTRRLAATLALNPQIALLKGGFAHLSLAAQLSLISDLEEQWEAGMIEIPLDSGLILLVDIFHVLPPPIVLPPNWITAITFDDPRILSVGEVETDSGIVTVESPQPEKPQIVSIGDDLGDDPEILKVSLEIPQLLGVK